MMIMYCNLNDLFSSLDVTALSHCCQIGSQCHWSALQNIVERFRFSVLSWSHEVLLGTKWLRWCANCQDGPWSKRCNCYALTWAV